MYHEASVRHRIILQPTAITRELTCRPVGNDRKSEAVIRANAVSILELRGPPISRFSGIEYELIATIEFFNLLEKLLS